MDAPITINGVVYNEMKGAYSSPDEMLQTAIFQNLFPDNTYGKDSGGNPAHIPELTPGMMPYKITARIATDTPKAPMTPFQENW